MDESEVLKFENQVKVLKLSEAIRIGAKIRPQSTMDVFHNGGSCVFGAAWEGIGGSYGDSDAVQHCLAKWPGVVKSYRARYKNGLIDDNYLMTREEIATRLEAVGC